MALSPAPCLQKAQPRRARTAGTPSLPASAVSRWAPARLCPVGMWWVTLGPDVLGHAGGAGVELEEGRCREWAPRPPPEAPGNLATSHPGRGAGSTGGGAGRYGFLKTSPDGLNCHRPVVCSKKTEAPMGNCRAQGHTSKSATDAGPRAPRLLLFPVSCSFPSPQTPAMGHRTAG